jgi:hypothetical protein
MPDEGSKFSDDEKDTMPNHKLKFPRGWGGGGEDGKKLRLSKSHSSLCVLKKKKKKALMLYGF